MNSIEEEVLLVFDSIEIQNTSDTAKVDKRLQVCNLHLCNGFPVEGEDELPLVKPYTGQLPVELDCFTKRHNISSSTTGIHLFQYDYEIERSWNKATDVLKEIKNFSCVVAPDFSLFVDQGKALNIVQLYKNRWVTCYWQQEGVNVIPSASWGNANSFKYCFQGLPENSVIAVGHSAVGRTASEKRLYKEAIHELIAQKHPTMLLVYGFPLGFDPGVEVIYHKCHIQKLREQCTKTA